MATKSNKEHDDVSVDRIGYPIFRQSFFPKNILYLKKDLQEFGALMTKIGGLNMVQDMGFSWFFEPVRDVVSTCFNSQTDSIV